MVPRGLLFVPAVLHLLLSLASPADGFSATPVPVKAASPFRSSDLRQRRFLPTSTSSSTSSSPPSSPSFPALLTPMMSLQAVVEDDFDQPPSFRRKLRRLTGFSLTAFRATWRAATGISLSAIYASALAASGLWIRKIMSTILSIFPAWFRYFLQPFLILYYAPLFILRGLTGPNRRRARAKHMQVVESWNDALDYAEQVKAEGYIPIRKSEDGLYEAVKPPSSIRYHEHSTSVGKSEDIIVKVENMSDDEDGGSSNLRP